MAGKRRKKIEEPDITGLKDFEVDRYVPTRIDITPNGGGPHDERAVLERTIEGDRTYVMDRGYAKFALFNRIVAVGSS